jgi:DNA ligase-associated metallophosphoesterase
MRERLPHLDLLGVAFLVTAEGALYQPDDGLLLVADLHLEKGSAHAARGRFVPPYDTLATLARLGAVIARLAPRTVICLGDSFENDGGPQRIDVTDRETLAGLQRGRDWVWLAGNHDPAPPAGLGGTAACEIAYGPLTLRHTPLRGAAPGEMAGHLHPVAVVRGTGGAVRRRCVASDGRRAVLPAFGAYAGGLDLRDRAFAGLFDTTRFVAFVLGDGQVWPVPAARCL